jgi:hypothetical protein
VSVHEHATDPSMLDAALEYARLGWPVVPLHSWTGTRCTCGNDECSSPAKHPRTRKGLNEATTDVDQIEQWWQQWPHANIGVRTGVAFDVLDVDGVEGEASLVDYLVANEATLPSGPAASTGGGGKHLLFHITGAGNRAGMLAKVDWRGRGGYIVAPPSLHRSGQRYSWDDPPATPLEFVPDALRTLVSPPDDRPAHAGHARPLPGGIGDGTAYGIRALDAELDELRRAAPGTRNHTLNQTAYNLFQLVAGGELAEVAVEGRLRDTAMSIGLGDHETDQTLQSARRAGLAAPRNAPVLHALSRDRTGKPTIAPTRAQPDAHLPDEFWAARPELEHIRAAARSRIVAPDAVLGAVLTRIAAITPHMVELPATIGVPIGLTYFVGIVGPSSAGKSAGAGVAAELLPAPDHILDRLPIGSGEGMVEILFDLVTEDGDNGKPIKVKRQTRHAAIFHIDEGAVLADLGNRQGTTLLPTLRTAYSHGTLGNTNASAERKRIVDGNAYVYGITLGIQPEKAGPLLGDVDAGTPQRFVWVTATDPAAPDNAPEWPGELTWAPPPPEILRDRSIIRGRQQRHPLSVHPAIRAEIIADRLGIVRGEVDRDAADAHIMLVRLKTAALLALLDRRIDIEVDDWELAGVITAVSRRLRRQMEGTLEVVARLKDQAAEQRHVRRELAVETSKEQKALTSAARSIGNVVRKHAENDEHTDPAGCARRCLHGAMNKKMRDVISTDDAIAEAEHRGFITAQEGRFVPGDSRPA